MNINTKGVYRFFVFLALGLGLFFIKIDAAEAATKYWIGTAGGGWVTDSNWTTTAGSSCGSNANTTAPGSSDTAVFTSNCTNSVTFDLPTSIVGAIDMQSGYTGTLTQNLALNTTGNLTIGSSATVDTNDKTLDVDGTFSNEGTLRLKGTETTFSATMDTDSGTVVYYGTTSVSSLKAGNSYYNLTFNASGGNWGPAAAVDVNGTFTITAGTYNTNNNNLTIAGNFSNSGTFTAGTATTTLDGTNQTITGSSNTTFYNLTKTASSTDTLTFNNARTTTISNNTTLQGSSTSARLSIVSDSTGTQWEIDPSSSGTRTFQYLVVQDSNNTNATVANCTTGCLNSGNNTNWSFGGGYSVAGTVYSDEGSTALASVTVRLAVNGTDIDTNDTNGSGAYTISNITAAAGDVLTIYLEDETQDAVTVTIATGGALSSMNLYQDRLITRCDNSSCSLTNGNLSTGAVSSETDISNIYSISSGNLTVASNKELFVLASHTFAPGGTVTADDVDINGTLTLSSNAGSVSGTWDATGGTFTTSGTVTFTSTGTETITSNSNSFANVTWSGSGGTWTLVDALDVNGTVTITAGTLADGGNGITLTGDWSNAGTYTGTGTVTLDGTGTQTLTTGGTGTGQDFQNLTINKASGTASLATNSLDVDGTLTVSSGTFSPGALNVTAGALTTEGGTFTSATGSVDVNGAFTLTSGTFTAPSSGTFTVSGNFSRSAAGTFTHNSGTVTLDGSDQTITGTITFNNLTKSVTSAATLTFNASAVKTVEGTLTLNGASGQLLSLRSSSSGTQWRISPSGTRTVSYLDVKDSNNTHTDTINCTNNCTDSGNNTNWSFGGGYSVAGTAYSDEGSTALSSVTVRVAVNGTDIDTADTNGSGAYTISNITAAAGDVLTIYLEDETQDAVTVTIATGAALSSMNLFQDRLITRCDNSCSLTNSNLSTGAVASEADISNIYSVSSGNLTVASGKELFVLASHTFVPGGTVTADDVDINGTFTLGSNAASVSGTWDATGGTFTSTGTVTFTSTSTETITSNSNSFTNSTFNGSGGSWTLSDDLDVDTNLTITAGTLVDGGQDITVGGNYSNAGTITATGTITFDGTGAQSLTSGGTGTGQDFQTLIVNKSSGTLSLATNALDVDGTLTVTSGTFSPGALNVTAGAITTQGGTFTGATGNVDVNGTFTLTSGTFTAPSSGTFTVSGNFSRSATGTFTHNSGTVTLDGTDQTITGNLTFHNLTKSVTTAATITFSASHTKTIEGILTLNGAAGQLLSLRSSSSGAEWKIAPAGTRTISYLNVKDSNNTHSDTINCTNNCTDSGNNTNWNFGASGSASGEVETVTASAPANISQATDGTGYVTFKTTVRNTDNITSRLKIEYSLDGSNWKDPSLVSVNASQGDATLTNGDEYQIASIDTDTGEVVLTIVWESKEQINELYDSSVFLRLTPNNGTANGDAVESDAFTVDNKAPGITSWRVAARTATTLKGSWQVSASDPNFQRYRICYAFGANRNDALTCTGVATIWDETDDANLTQQDTTTTTLTGLDTRTYRFALQAADTFGNVASITGDFTSSSRPPVPILRQVTATDTSITVAPDSIVSSRLSRATLCYNRNREAVRLNCLPTTVLGQVGDSNSGSLTLTATPLPATIRLESLAPNTIYYLRLIAWYDDFSIERKSSVIGPRTCPAGQDRTSSGVCVANQQVVTPVLEITDVASTTVNFSTSRINASRVVQGRLCYSRVRSKVVATCRADRDGNFVRFTGAIPAVTSFQNLLPNTEYFFRLFVDYIGARRQPSVVLSTTTCGLGQTRLNGTGPCMSDPLAPTPTPTPTVLPLIEPTASPTPPLSLFGLTTGTNGFLGALTAIIDNVVTAIFNFIERVFETVIDIIQKVINFLRQLLTNPREALARLRAALKPLFESTTAKAITTALAVTAAAAVIASAGGLTGAPTLLSQLWQFITRLWHNLLSAFGFKRGKKRPWGRVVDAATGDPIPGATIQIFEHQWHRLLSTVVTNEQGSFSSLVPPGTYEFRIVKAGWSLTPTAPLLHHTLGEHIYDGKPVTVTTEKLVPLVLAMRMLDTVPTTRYILWRLAAQWVELVLQKLSWPLLVAGLLFNTIAVWVSANWLNVGIEVLYGLLILWKVLAHARQRPTLGIIRDALTGRAVDLAVVRLYNATTGALVETKATSRQGSFIFLPAAGVYTISVTREGYEPYRESHIIVDANRESLSLSFSLQPAAPQPLTVSGLTSF